MVRAEGTPARTWIYLCRGCGAPVAADDQWVSIQGRPAEGVFTNPLGAVCGVLTVCAAGNVRVEHAATEEHTWFEGYAWRPAACSGCGAHVGWRYEAAAAGLDPDEFFGLLLEAVRKTPAEVQ